MASIESGLNASNSLELVPGDYVRFNETVRLNPDGSPYFVRDRMHARVTAVYGDQVILNKDKLMLLGAIAKQVNSGAIEVNPTSGPIYSTDDARYKLAVDTGIMPGAIVRIDDSEKLVVDVQFDKKSSKIVIVFDDNTSMTREQLTAMSIMAE